MTQFVTSPEERLRNLKRHYDLRYSQCRTPAEAVRVSFERAKAAARRGEADGDAGAMQDLAVQLAQWAERRERAAAEKMSQNVTRVHSA